MPTSPPSEDYIIALLKRDAAASSSKNSYSTLGPLLSRSTTSDSRTAQPVHHNKINTRFLRNIIRDTDSHNAALKAREETEAKARLRDLKRAGAGSDERTRKRPRVEREGRWANVLGGLGKRETDGGTESAKRRKRDDGENGRRHVKVKDEQRKRSTRAPAPSREDRAPGTSRHHRHRGRHRREETGRHTSETPSPPRASAKNRSPQQSSNPPSHTRNTKPKVETEAVRPKHQDSDSDPLEALLGPLPPQSSQPRGRGAKRRRLSISEDEDSASRDSDIDAHFAAEYDPTSTSRAKNRDEHDSEIVHDDWTTALKALKARAKRQGRKGVLDSDGDEDDDVGSMDRGIGQSSRSRDGWNMEREKGVEDVKWRKQGEGREWDRGKVGVD